MKLLKVNFEFYTLVKRFSAITMRIGVVIHPELSLEQKIEQLDGYTAELEKIFDQYLLFAGVKKLPIAIEARDYISYGYDYQLIGLSKAIYCAFQNYTRLIDQDILEAEIDVYLKIPKNINYFIFLEILGSFPFIISDDVIEIIKDMYLKMNPDKEYSSKPYPSFHATILKNTKGMDTFKEEGSIMNYILENDRVPKEQLVGKTKQVKNRLLRQLYMPWFLLGVMTCLGTIMIYLLVLALSGK